jgi:Neocarzinostatin family
MCAKEVLPGARVFSFKHASRLKTFGVSAGESDRSSSFTPSLGSSVRGVTQKGGVVRLRTHRKGTRLASAPTAATACDAQSRGIPRKLRPALVNHVIGIAGLLALVLGVIGALAGPGEAASPSLSVTPSTNLADGQQVTVTGTDVGASNFVAVVECGNADASGNALPGNAPTPADCYGFESIGSQTILIIADANGTASTPYTVHDHGIGANNRRCIDNGNFDCVIAMADVATQGQALLIAAPICFGEGCTVGPPPPAIVNPGLLPTTTPTGPEEEAPPAPSPAPAAPVQAAAPFTG